MPTMHVRNTRSPHRRGRVVAAVAVAGAVALIAAGCTSDGDEQVQDPSRILQTVETTLSPDGSITGISDTAISVASSNRSSSKTTEHDPAKAASDLPIRVTTQYTTANGTGTDLTDLDGYSGRVEIDLTVENLTVQSKQLRYDVAGTSQTKSALVGSPFSVAASTVLQGVAPSSIVTASDDSSTATDGVVSRNAKGDAVVQWGTLLAPPTSGASSTLHLVADVQDFSAPSFDLAAQPGLSTDLSSKGIMAAAFGSDSDSELALQRRTIDLIAQVNEVLARAGGTITEVRSNLETTSKTLGVSTAERLKESSSSLAATMQGLGTELTSLKGDLGSTVSATQSTVLGQLDQTVTSLDSLLGDTSARAPEPTVDGEGCAAVPVDPGATASVYGNLLRVSAQLDGYAAASEDCKEQVSAALTSSVGPEETNDEVCAEDQPAAASLTCSLFGSSKKIDASLLDLKQTGDELANELSTTTFDQIDALAVGIGKNVEAVQKYGSELATGNVEDLSDALQELTDLANEVDDDLTRSLTTRIRSVHDDAVARQAVVGTETDTVQAGSRSLQAQNRYTADRVCQLVEDGKLSEEDGSVLRGNLTSVPCEPTDDEGQPNPDLQPSGGFTDPMDTRLTTEAGAWADIAKATDLDSDDPDGIGALVASLIQTVSDVQQSVRQVADSVSGSDEQSVIGRINTLNKQANLAQDKVGELQDYVENHREDFSEKIKDSFANASTSSTKDIQDVIADQSTRVAKTATESNDALVKAFDQSISGLAATSDEVTKDAKGTIDQQKGKLQQQTSGLAAAVDAQTQASLQRIDQSTSASTRDVEGAATLLAGDLNRVMLDLGDRKVNGSGILGAMATSAAKSDTADYQLALASQNASGYANIRAEDVAGILLQQAQLRASLDAASSLPAFRMDVPAGATSTTLYAFRIGAAK